MPGASLWLVPPKDSQIDGVLFKLLLTTIPQHFPAIKAPPIFDPHLTLTSDIPQDTFSHNPQAWLDSLPLALNKPPRVLFQSLDVDKPYFKKLTMRAVPVPLLEIATQVRAAAVEKGDFAAAEKWAKDAYAPHVSLLYADIDISEEKRKDILQELDRVGIKLKCESALTGRESGCLDGWKGGRIVLVSTWKKLEDWAVIAERVL